jgi:cytochrome c-type biogenesis protein CcmF
LRYYDIKFTKIDQDLNVLDSFILRPTAQYSNDFTKLAAFNPDTRHYFTKDVFSCLTNLPPHLTDNDLMKEMEDSIKFTKYNVKLGDTITTDIHKIVITDLNNVPTHPEYKHDKHDFGVQATLQIFSLENEFIREEIAAIGLEGSLIYSYPAKIESENTRIRLDEEILDIYLSKEENLKYDFYTVKQGETFEYKGNTLKLVGFDKEPTSKNYEKQEGDIAVSAILDVKGESSNYTSKPLYVIRGSSPMSIKDYNASNGLHLRLSNINPQEEAFTFKIAKDERKIGAIPVQVATNVPRSDYIILTATVFPGINMFWAGSLMMMIGLLWGWINKLRQKTILAVAA